MLSIVIDLPMWPCAIPIYSRKTLYLCYLSLYCSSLTHVCQDIRFFSQGIINCDEIRQINSLNLKFRSYLSLYQVELSLKGNRLENIPHELLKRNALLKRLDVSRNQMTDINFSALSNNT